MKTNTYSRNLENSNMPNDNYSSIENIYGSIFFNSPTYNNT